MVERRAKALAWLTMALWVVQTWRPQLSYPGNGVAELALLLLFLVLTIILTYGSTPCRSSAAGIGIAFIVYGSARWIAAGAPAAGAENFGTLLEAAIWAAVVYNLMRIPSGSGKFVCAFLLVVSALALVCGIHAIAQYFYLYDLQLADLKAAIGSAEPTPLQIGLMHHMQLKRVASIWGDPNALGAFLALSLAASYWCASRLRQSFGVGLIGILAIPLALAGIGLSGSRGAVLDAVLVSLLCLWPTMKHRKAAIAVAICSWCLLGAGQTMLTRSNTLRERVNYAEVGLKIIQRNPVFGSAPGAVDLFYGRYKPPEARESKYLHNWPLQITAEYGLVGLGLGTAFVVLLLWRGAKSDLISHPEYLAAYAICAVFLVDALFELSFNHRELMALFAMATGIVLFMASRKVDKPRGEWLAIGSNLLLAALAVALVFPQLIASEEKDAAADAMQDKDLDTARKLVRRAGQWTPRDPSVYLMLSQVEDMAGSPESSIMHLKKAISIQPESASLRAQLSRMEAVMGHTDDAERLIRQAIELYPGNGDYHYDLAQVLERRGNLKSALDEARLAVKFGYYNLDKYKAYAAQLEKQAAGK